jgi:cytochrome c oxidase cbb3-type subunit 3
MSSASKFLIGVAAVLVTMNVACGQPPPSGGNGGTSPPTVTVGPVPGPASPGVSANANPYAQNRAAMVEGRQLFVRFNCSGCHGGRAGGGMGPSLRDVDWIYGQEDARIYSSIAEGRAHGMPAWQPRLTSDQIWKLVTYIQSLRTRNEPNPPS